MAILKNYHFGNISGTIGNLVYRNRNGVTFIYSKPKKVKISNSAASIANRRKFGLLTKISQAMNRDFIMNTIWKTLPGERLTNANKQMKINSPLCGTGDDISGLVLFPVAKCFSGLIQDILVVDNTLMINLVLSVGAASISSKVYPWISAHGIMKLTSIPPKKHNPIVFIPLSSGDIPFTKDVPLQFKIPIVGQELHLFNEYPLRSFTLGLVIKNKSGDAVYFSENLNGELVL